MELKCLQSSNWGRHKLFDGQVLRSNEHPGPDGDIIVHKNRAMLDRYYQIFPTFRPRTVFELGVREGGSLVLWYELFLCPIVGIDNDITQLSSEFIEYTKGKPIVVGHMDAFDSDRVTSFRSRSFWSTIDLIVDDCQHTIEQIPHNLKLHWEVLSPGGQYIIEDWKALTGDHRVELLGIIARHTYDTKSEVFIHDELIQITKVKSSQIGAKNA